MSVILTSTFITARGHGWKPRTGGQCEEEPGRENSVSLSQSNCVNSAYLSLQWRLPTREVPPSLRVWSFYSGCSQDTDNRPPCSRLVSSPSRGQGDTRWPQNHIINDIVILGSVAWHKSYAKIGLSGRILEGFKGCLPGARSRGLSSGKLSSLLHIHQPRNPFLLSDLTATTDLL